MRRLFATPALSLLALPAPAQERRSVLLDAMLARHDLAPDAVTRGNTGWSISPALLADQGDGVIGAARDVELNRWAIEGTEGRCFHPEAGCVPACDALNQIADPDTMDADAATLVSEATAQADSFTLNQPKLARKLSSGTTSELQSELNRRASADAGPHLATRPAATGAGRDSRFEGFPAERGATPGGLSVQALAFDVTAVTP